MLINETEPSRPSTEGEDVDEDEEGLSGAAVCRRREPRFRAGQDLRPEDFALGAGVASAAEGAGRLGAAVKKDSGGTIKCKVFPAQQLGKAFDHYDMARDGIADVTYVNPGYQPGRFPIVGAGELPFLISDAKGGSMGLDAWYRKYAEKEMKDVKYCLAFVHSPSSFHSKTKKIVMPEDVKGLKIRPAHATMANFVTSLGGTNVQSSAPRSATSSSAALPTASPSPGARWCCSASTRRPSTTWRRRSTPRPSCS